MPHAPRHDFRQTGLRWISGGSRTKRVQEHDRSEEVSGKQGGDGDGEDKGGAGGRTADEHGSWDATVIEP
ncbi:hypothetical protein Apa02nite_100130 [Actinoplanes palleronii]|uniref:Uncharacterized protein n=1 Tax=Actinoplanes palleronii TaxID=113570 RepID=A0ABQ4BTD2_9ACTN|nr:hypothetical protein Apa02nite_100130 [Actinoplanes palleronii]